MLTQKQRQKLTKNLPYGYSKRVCEILIAKGIVNHNGESYSEASVRNVVAGRENLDIEAALLDYYEEVENTKQAAKQRAKEKLNT